MTDAPEHEVGDAPRDPDIASGSITDEDFRTSEQIVPQDENGDPEPDPDREGTPAEPNSAD